LIKKLIFRRIWNFRAVSASIISSDSWKQPHPPPFAGLRRDGPAKAMGKTVQNRLRIVDGSDRWTATAAPARQRRRIVFAFAAL
jgi:hypothetical protein